MRLLSSGVVKADGTSLIGLEVNMPADTKTYWRVPGDTGIPTELSFTGSTGVGGHQILWPYPMRDETEDYLDYVYYGPTLLPIELRVDDAAARIEVSVVMGVCSDICIPAQAEFSMPVAEGGKDMPNALRIKQAAALAPIQWEGEEPPIGDVEFRPHDNALAVWVADPGIDPASLIAAMADGDLAFGTPQKSPEPNLVLIPLLGKVADGELDSRPVQLTFITDMGAFEITRTLGGEQD
ncbi:protein-disulfide reductase DsbD domain-containing protein [Devosia limi]|nr:protein-disulfide reductase DsbD domain-containing protein [Devosia limi]